LRTDILAAQFFVGVDGGASKCTVRIEDEAGRLLGRTTGGPASIRLSVEEAWEAIYAAIAMILGPLGMRIDDGRYHWHVGMGLAGSELPDACHAFQQKRHPFETLIVTSDAHIACLGAHAGNDGAIMIVGTGAVGFQVAQGQTTKVGGWGFPHDDEGSGAWLGLEAVRLTFRWLDGRGPASHLTDAVYAHFGHDIPRLVTWANRANSTAFAGLTPLIVQQAKMGDAMARGLLERAASAMGKIHAALLAKQPTSPEGIALPCALVGGMSRFLVPYMEPGLHARLSSCQLTPDAGAALLVRQHWKHAADSHQKEVKHV
jgi:glucosamine kinase